jgi:hypothetical protein
MPEHAELLLTRRADPQQCLNRGVHAEELVIARDRLDQTTGSLGVRDKVLYHVEKPVGSTGSPDDSLQLDPASRARHVDLFPLAEVLPRRERRANPSL